MMIRNSFVACSIAFVVFSYKYLKNSNEEMRQILLEKGYMDENNHLKSKAMKNILGRDTLQSSKAYTEDKKKSE